MKRQITCIICPMGCQMEAEIEDGKMLGVVGNTCPRGAAYALSECTNPQRTVTTTVRCDDGSVLPVKTESMIPKAKVFECMEIINRTVAHLPVEAGDTVIEDCVGSRIIATASRKKRPTA